MIVAAFYINDISRMAKRKANSDAFNEHGATRDSPADHDSDVDSDTEMDQPKSRSRRPDITIGQAHPTSLPKIRNTRHSLASSTSTQRFPLSGGCGSTGRTGKASAKNLKTSRISTGTIR